jgi:NAD(P)-dependent dehydrogenase (short-subunit alcohol dehydrogenase family)
MSVSFSLEGKVAIVTGASRGMGESVARAFAQHGAQVAAAIERLGKVDIMVNNAGTNPYFGPMLAVDEGAWDKTFEVNVKGYFFMAREVASANGSTFPLRKESSSTTAPR